MKKLTFLLSLSFLLSVYSLESCGPDHPDPKPPKNVKIQIHHIFGNDSTPFKLNGAYIEKISGDTFTPTTLVYHINHFELSNASGDIIRLSKDNPYRMIDLADESSLLTINESFGEPKNSFTTLSFYIGVEDSLTNDQGLLNSVFTSPMYWGMINGYIHFKLEGNLHTQPQKSVVLHVGGYMEPYKLARKITIPLNSPLDFSKGDALLTIDVDLQRYFDGVNKINMNTVNLIHQPGDDAAKIADNWSGMFSDGGITYY